jgi:hypothetical protein
MKRITDQDELEGLVGGSFIDDLLGEIDYPPEDDMKWFIDEEKEIVYMEWNKKIFSRSSKYTGGDGYDEEEWKELNTNDNN